MMNFSNLEAGKQCELVMLVKTIENTISKNGNPYQKLVARDKEGHEMSIFNWDGFMDVTTPVIITAVLDVKQYKDDITCKLVNYRVNEGESIDDFMPKSQINPKRAWNELVKASQPIRTGLRKIAGAILMDYRREFMKLPLNKMGAFSRVNGILEATLQLTRLAIHATDVLGLDYGLMVSGALLYYIGNIDMIDESFNATDCDVLIGAGMGAASKVDLKIRDIIEGTDEAAKDAINAEDVKLLKHILISRFKGIQTAIPEALVLRYLDAMVRETDAIKATLEKVDEGSVVKGSGLEYNMRVYKRHSDVHDMSTDSEQIA